MLPVVIVLLLIAAVVTFVIVLKKKQKVEDENDQNPPVAVDPEVKDETPTDKLIKLKSGGFVDFGVHPFSASADHNCQLVGRGECLCLSGPKRNFAETGEKYLVFEFEKDMFFIQRPDGWFGFNQSIILEGEEANQFNEAGTVFSQKGQTPRCHSFTWRDKQLSILDVGYLRYQHLEGKSHLKTGNMVKWMLSENEADGNKTVYFLENLKEGTDRIWIGKSFGMNLDKDIADIFPLNV